MGRMKMSTSNPASDWRAIRVKSPAGVWYIARNHDDAVGMGKKKRVNEEGENISRAVFFREELNHSLPKLEKLTDQERQEWLREIIQIKQVFEAATVVKVTLKDINYSE